MKKISCLLGCLLFTAQANAVDGFAVEYGGNSQADMYRAAVTWDLPYKWFTEGSWQVGTYLDASVGQWHGNSNRGGDRTITDIGLTPTFRLEQTSKSNIAPYLEAAIGAHLISTTRINNYREFSTAFQFGDHIGAGLQFGSRHQYDLSVRMQHLSNGSIKKPNDGIDFAQVRFAYHLK